MDHAQYANVDEGIDLSVEAMARLTPMPVWPSARECQTNNI